MFTRIFLSLLVALVVGLGTVRLWQILTKDDIDQIARIAESESYAARSLLSKNLEDMLSSLELVRTHWSAVGQLPPEEWPTEAGIDGEQFVGVNLLLWEDPEGGSRYVRSQSSPGFRHVSDVNEPETYRGLLGRSKKAGRNTMAGPFRDSEDHPYFEVYLSGRNSQAFGVLGASIDAQALLANLMSDDSPGYAVKVFWGDELLYQRGEPGKNLPPSWTREGIVETSTGAVWRVVHTPTKELAESMASPSIDLFLVLGLVISVLMATLTFENWRSYSRAHAAEVAEKRLADLNRHLEQEVASRTRQLANRTTDLQTITDSVAHDLRNPLNAIAVNVQLFESKFRDRLTPDSTVLLQRITPAVRQMAEILDRMLGLSRVAHATFQPETLNMADLVSKVFSDLAAAEPPPDVQLEVADLPPARADRKLVKMLLMNVIGNALKYTRQKNPRCIRVGFEQTQYGGTYRIEDNGIGFDSNSTDRLFVAFQRMAELKITEGIGLGLAIAARVVGRHGGRIWAKGIPGEGATFYFTLEPVP